MFREQGYFWRFSTTECLCNNSISLSNVGESNSSSLSSSSSSHNCKQGAGNQARRLSSFSTSHQPDQNNTHRKTSRSRKELYMNFQFTPLWENIHTCFVFDEHIQSFIHSYFKGLIFGIFGLVWSHASICLGNKRLSHIAIAQTFICRVKSSVDSGNTV